MERPGDASLIDHLLTVMQATGADWTRTFRNLTKVSIGDAESVSAFVEFVLGDLPSLDVIRARTKPKYDDDQLRVIAPLLVCLLGFHSTPHIDTDLGSTAGPTPAAYVRYPRPCSFAARAG